MRTSISSDEGFTFVELLVVLVVIGVLAAIAIPRFLDQRERAWEVAAYGTVHDAVLAEQTVMVDSQTYSAAQADLVAVGLTHPADVDFWVDASTTATRFQVHAQHCNGGDQFRFVSDGAATVERVARAARAC
jgi:type IV pilus assembly protein PilA